MVTFKANVYHENNDNLIGAEVIVYDGDTPIDSILITSKSSYDELVEEINNLSSRFVSFYENSVLSGQTIEQILSNSENEITINASQLNGHPANYYAKESHNHSISQISDLYNYDISLSNYNPVINNGASVTVTATVTVTKKSTGFPVSNESVALFIDGVVQNGTTNSSGKFSTTYRIYDGGLHTFAVENQKVQLFAKEVNTWKTIYSTQYFTLQSKGEHRRLLIDTGNTTVRTPVGYEPRIDFVNDVNQSLSSYMPTKNVSAIGSNKVGYLLQHNGKLFSFNISGSEVNASHNCMLQWVL